MSDQGVQADSSTVNFTGDCGECKSGYYTVSTTVGMQPGQSATVNGSPPQNCIVGNDGAKVYSITLQKQAGFYSYVLDIDAQGPSGPFSGSFYLAFQDATGDVYYIFIYSSDHEQHTLAYNSSNPNITKIFWSDYSFTVKDGVSNGEKPKYQVTSPANKKG